MKVIKLKLAKDHGHQFQSREQFIDFVREISPQADVTSIMLFGQTHHASHLLMQAAEKNLESVGLSWPKFRLLMHLMHGERHHGTEGMQPSELSTRQGVSRNTVSALISSLEKDGLLSRELHGEDRRKFLIHLTPSGRKILHTQLDNQFKYVAQCFDVFTLKERELLLNLLGKLNTSLSEKTNQSK